MKKLLLFVAVLLCAATSQAQKRYTLCSPDKNLTIAIEAGAQLTYSVTAAGEPILQSSPVGLQLSDGRTIGANPRISKVSKQQVNNTITAQYYKRAQVADRYNELTLHLRDGFAVIFRAYDDGVAYRFISESNADFTVMQEVAEFRFGADHNAFIPYVKNAGKSINDQYFNSFENTYTQTELSKMNPQRLVFAPVVVEVGTRKVCLTEADLESYPGMFLHNPDRSTTLTGHFASLPKAIKQGGHNRLQGFVSEREKQIASCKAGAKLPWRIVIVTDNDTQLADNDFVYRLASPARITDTAWIKPGKVAWEWWNDWGLKGVDFRAGVNDDTYKAYIDFAAEHGIEYVILDEGWSVNLAADLMQVVPEIDLEELVAYATEKQVGLILWAGYWAFDRDMEQICDHYAKMGIKGFKIDFMDRDDQQMVDFHYRAAETAARHHLLVDFHGTYKPTGLNRTYPNVINFEGVHGLEQVKWGTDIDQVTYDVTMPFTRMVAGPVDYTQGAMRNATRDNYRAVNSEPMSQGTRCHQLGAYVVFESPLSMLCDSPTAYAEEPECSAFIASVPTTWDETIALQGRIGKLVVTARRKADTWYIGGLTDWKARKFDLDLSFLDAGEYTAEIFCDGMNSDKIASDFNHKIEPVAADRRLQINTAPGGGFAVKITRK